MSRPLRLALVLCLFGSIASASPIPTVTCAACIVVDDTGTVIFSKSPEDRRANASTTKMVTALVAVEHLGPDDRVEVPPDVGGVTSSFELQPGDRYSVRDMLAAMMLESWNDAAVTLADAASGSQGAFVQEMDAYVRRLGLRNTAFVNPHGLDAAGHYSSASDLALIAEVVLADPLLAEIVASPSASIRHPSGPARLESRNLLLDAYDGAIGVKTGQTLQAGNVLVAAARRDGRTIIAVVMGSADTFADAATLLDLGFATPPPEPRVVLAREGDPAAVIVFGSLSSTPVGFGRTVRGAYDPEEVTVSLQLDDDLTLPLDEGRSVGMIVVEVDEGVVRRVPGIALEPVEYEADPWGTRFFAGLLGLFEPVAGP